MRFCWDMFGTALWRADARTLFSVPSRAAEPVPVPVRADGTRAKPAKSRLWPPWCRMARRSRQHLTASQGVTGLHGVCYGARWRQLRLRIRRAVCGAAHGSHESRGLFIGPAWERRRDVQCHLILGLKPRFAGATDPAERDQRFNAGF